MMIVLVSYDVSTPDEAGRRRLRRVARFCEDRGQRVQNSVFECVVDSAQWVVFRATLVSERFPLRIVSAFTFSAPNGEDASSTSAQNCPTTLRHPSFSRRGALQVSSRGP